jgi:hypothetical protein
MPPHKFKVGDVVAINPTISRFVPGVFSKDLKAGGHRRTLQHSGKAGGCERCPSLRDEHERRCRRLTVKPTQSPHRRVLMISQPLEL